MKTSLNPSRLRSLLRYGSAGCWSGAIACVVWAVWPASDTPSSVKRAARLVSPVALSNSVAESVQWNRPLQGSNRNSVSKPQPAPERKPAPSPRIAARPVPTSLGVRLIGTITENRKRIAIASDRSGRLVFHTEGEELQLQPVGIRVEKITNNKIRVRYQNRSHSISVGDELKLAKTIAKSSVGIEPTDVDAMGEDSGVVDPMNDESSINESTVNKSGTTKSDRTKSAAFFADSRWDDEEDEEAERTILDVDEFPEMDLDAELDMLNGF